jgi:hypothetical protein
MRISNFAPKNGLLDRISKFFTPRLHPTARLPIVPAGCSVSSTSSQTSSSHPARRSAIAIHLQGDGSMEIRDDPAPSGAHWR